MSQRPRHDTRFVVVTDNWSSEVQLDDVLDYLKKYQIHYSRRQFHQQTHTRRPALVLYHATYDDALDTRKRLIQLCKLERLRILVRHIVPDYSYSDSQGSRQPSGGQSDYYDNFRSPDHSRQPSNKLRLPTLGEYRCKVPQEGPPEPIHSIPPSEYSRERSSRRDCSESSEHPRRSRLNSRSFYGNRSKRGSRSRSRSRSRSKGLSTVRHSREPDLTSDTPASTERNSAERQNSTTNLDRIELLNEKVYQPAFDSKHCESHPLRDEKYSYEQNTQSVSNPVIGETPACEMAQIPEVNSLDAYALPVLNSVTADSSAQEKNHVSTVIEQPVADAQLFKANQQPSPIAHVELFPDAVLNVSMQLASVQPLQNPAARDVIPPFQNQILTQNCIDVNSLQKASEFRSQVLKNKRKVNWFLRTLPFPLVLLSPLKHSHARFESELEPETIDLTVPNPTILPKKRKTCA